MTNSVRDAGGVSRVGNPQLWAWFDQGKISDAIRGQGEFFLNSHTWVGSHDLTLVLDQLIFWADARDARPAAIEAIEEAISKSSEQDPNETIDIAWSAVIVGDYEFESLLSERAVEIVLQVARKGRDEDPLSAGIVDRLIERYTRPPGWYHMNTEYHERPDWGQVRWWDGRRWSLSDQAPPG